MGHYYEVQMSNITGTDHLLKMKCAIKLLQWLMHTSQDFAFLDVVIECEEDDAQPINGPTRDEDAIGG